MTDKVKRFCEEYIVDLNGAASVIRAGYSEKTAKEQASRLLTNVNVQKEIIRLKEARSERTKIDADKVLHELAAIGFSNINDYLSFSGKGITLKDSGSIPLDKLGAISEASQTVNLSGTNVRFKLHDKLSALDKIARHIGGFYKDKEDAISQDKITEIRKTVVTKIVFGDLDEI